MYYDSSDFNQASVNYYILPANTIANTNWVKVDRHIILNKMTYIVLQHSTEYKLQLQKFLLFDIIIANCIGHCRLSEIIL